MGGIYIADPRTAVADFSIPYIVTDIAALIHVPRELSKWAALMRPYQNNVWIPLAFTLLMSGPIGFLISQKDRSNRRKFSMQQVYETAFKIFTQQGKIVDLRGWHSTEIALAPLTQQTWVHPRSPQNV